MLFNREPDFDGDGVGTGSTKPSPLSLDQQEQQRNQFYAHKPLLSPVQLENTQIRSAHISGDGSVNLVMFNPYRLHGISNRDWIYFSNGQFS